MLASTLYWLVNMSVSASVAGLLLWLLGKIRSIPRRLLHILWGIVLLRLWIPIGVGSPWSLLTLLLGRAVPLPEPNPQWSMMNYMGAADAYFPIVYRTETLSRLFHAAGGVWAALAAALLIAAAVLYWSTLHTLKDARQLGHNVYCSDRITTPGVYGIFRPRILLPPDTKQADQPYILHHENAHIRRLDNLWRILAITTACVHWFNPLIWLFLKVFLENLELACDEAVLRGYTPQEQTRYAAALLNCAEQRSLWVSAFGGAGVRLRIQRILSYRRLSLFSGLALAVFALLTCLALLTNAQ